ncbi:MAG TPA: DUF4215 domain-containing protein [bacterium]|nr:DUF4215 domain-containing protein [bacterium]
MRRSLLAMAMLTLFTGILGADTPYPLLPDPGSRLNIPEALFGKWATDPLGPTGEELQPFIVNGQETNYQIYKGVVGLILNSSMGQSLCTATLIDPEVLLTAGHCVYLKENGVLVMNAVSNPGSITVKSGANIMYGGTTIAQAEQVVKHDTWTGDINSYGGLNADIALIKLDRQITDVEYYGIRTDPEENIGDPGIIVGYGITKTGAYDSGIHRWGNAKVLDKGTIMYKQNLLEVGDPSGTCQGDSGGPFFTTQNGQLVVSGVTSFGGQTCYADRDGYDTWVLKYYSWIEGIVQQFTGHGLLGSGVCGDGNDFCSQGQSKDCGLVDSRYESGTIAYCNSGCSYWDVSVCKPVCGDGELLSPELCESGDTADCGTLGQFLSGTTAPCRDDCTGYNTAYCTATFCGDGVKEGNEFCDTQLTSCETLGDYNKYSYARCNANCTGFDATDCVNQTIVCGNGTVDYLEQCDDGNNTSGDGCSSKCKIEGATVVCGNGIKEGAEECDDGNTTNGDGCSAGCVTEAMAVCGNGVREWGEECDDGNTANGDGCSAGCLSESPYAVCGNGTLETGEQCDDGNTVGGDGCSPACLTETGAVCGNGVKEGTEQCDDGNTTNGDGCSAACLTEDPNAECGNGIKEMGEQCDDGNMKPGDGCNPDCTLPATSGGTCGNGIKESYEQCDDGNLKAGDGCDPDCTIPGVTGTCGNGVKEYGEECDDGNVSAGDTCNPDCTRPTVTTPRGSSGGCSLILL